MLDRSDSMWATDGFLTRIKVSAFSVFAFSIYFSIKLCFPYSYTRWADLRFIYAIPFYLAERKFNLVFTWGCSVRPSLTPLNVVCLFIPEYTFCRYLFYLIIKRFTFVYRSTKPPTSARRTLSNYVVWIHTKPEEIYLCLVCVFFFLAHEARMRAAT